MQCSVIAARHSIFLVGSANLTESRHGPEGRSFSSRSERSVNLHVGTAGQIGSLVAACGKTRKDVIPNPALFSGVRDLLFLGRLANSRSLIRKRHGSGMTMSIFPQPARGKSCRIN
jgi:hypothetical protein